MITTEPYTIDPYTTGTNVDFFSIPYNPEKDPKPSTDRRKIDRDNLARLQESRRKRENRRKS